MGSAVAKPLTRRRGKVKTNELAENSVDWKVDENVNDNCQPSVDCLGSSLADIVKNLPKQINGKLEASNLLVTSHVGSTASPIKKLTVTTPRNTFNRTQSQKQSIVTSEAKVSKGLSILNRCFFSSICVGPHQKTMLSSKKAPESGLCNRKSEQPKKFLDTSMGIRNTSFATKSPRQDIANNSNRTPQKATENVSCIEVKSASALSIKTNGISSDKVGHITKQICTEDLNSAEREGGVAFFIPVTEDGLQPQADRTVVAERLTKKKKVNPQLIMVETSGFDSADRTASLNFEERMILANINRHAQLSKRKEFAVRDIRNVKGATSITDTTDKIKHDDDTNTDFDSSARNKNNISSELDVYFSKKASVDEENYIYFTKEGSIYEENAVYLAKKTDINEEKSVSFRNEADLDINIDPSELTERNLVAEYDLFMSSRTDNS